MIRAQIDTEDFFSEKWVYFLGFICTYVLTSSYDGKFQIEYWRVTEQYSDSLRKKTY